ncbi:MAG TPA: energy-coupling factor ABC transporter permease [Thiobacillaceae bacterium]|nr:energy-coupling factor ABC transporter permease [Thiobacillaceae bacterium]
MHIEPGIVDGAKMALGYATAVGVLGYTAKLAWGTVKRDGVARLGVRSLMAALMVFCFFQVLPHAPVGVSEVHLILGSTLFLVFGPAAAAIGLGLGLLTQGLFFAPADLPQYGMNVTTLLVPLFALSAVAARIIPEKTAYKDVSYKQCLALSTTYQAGIVTWVAFWAVYGQGVGAGNLYEIGAFGMAYMAVILIEPLVDLGVLAAAKTLRGFDTSKVFHGRLYNAA